MDGTLVDTEPYWIREEHELVESFGGKWSDELALKCVGNTLTASAEVIRENSAVTMTVEEIVDRLLTGVSRSMREHVPWRPGARELLQSCVAAGMPNALVTMSYDSFASVMIDTLPEQTFAAVVTGDIVRQGKPHPEPYLTAAEALGVQPQDCVAVEDSVPGVHSARAAGVPTIAVPHVVELPQLSGVVQIDSLVGLTAADLGALALQAIATTGGGRP
ncbi:HAD family phosphatase [Leekyejoonella antrihumi]|uniref:HAD family phosphatase n=2 Tax=Leekyejoonella antrihumi TaxID=1660198 RepID=A0A563DSK0_9MICO|nr:HAD family phosphatase [Leekyejoonella antrihumi]